MVQGILGAVPNLVTALSSLSVKSLPDLGMSIPSTMGQDGHERCPPQATVKFVTIKGPANWKLHLPSSFKRLNHKPAAADLQHP